MPKERVDRGTKDAKTPQTCLFISMHDFLFKVNPHTYIFFIFDIILSVSWLSLINYFLSKEANERGML